jgi:thiosulfate/3-mercaptopyruvate sulfurtransferase
MWYAIVICLGIITASPGSEERYPRGELLVEPADLSRTEVAKTFIILDVRPKAAYQAGHVPGAIWADAAAWAKEFQDGKDENRWHQRLGNLGIAPQRKVVIYDDNKNKDAARVWWILRYWGVKDARLMHGMWTGWKQGAHPISQDPVIPQTTTFESPAQRARLATKEELLRSLEDKTYQIVDARSAAEHSGENKLNNKRGGCIPGSKNLDWEQLVDPQTQRFKSAEELTRIFASINIDLKKPVAVHCQSGGRSSVMDFALELMGAAQVKNYHASWGEWGNAEDTPVERPGK